METGAAPPGGPPGRSPALGPTATLPRATLVLVRHGESTWIAEGRFQGGSDPPLSDHGRRQAAAVAARLADVRAAPSLPVPAGPPLAIWHSPLARAATVARAIHDAGRPAAPLTALSDLAELGQGTWEGLSHDEVRARFPAELRAWRDDPAHHHAPGGESLASAHGRARAARGAIVAALARAGRSDGGPLPSPAPPPGGPAEPVLGYRGAAVDAGDGSGPPWGIVVAHDGILRLLLLDLLDLPLERYRSFPFSLCAISVVEARAGVARLRAHNLTEHLAALEGVR